MADCPIMKLTDDCLISVFTHLTDIRDKVRLELVCWRFARLAAKPSVWKGSEQLEIKVQSEQWRFSAEDYPFCEINVKLPISQLSAAFSSILKRTYIHHLSFLFERSPEFRSYLIYGHQLLNAQLANMHDSITSNSARFKLLSFSFSGNVTDVDALFLPLQYSNSSLKSFELTFGAIEEAEGHYWMNFLPTLGKLLAECHSLERISLESCLPYGDTFMNVLQPALVNKPLKEVYFGKGFNVTHDHQYAQLCNSVSGSGITHLKTQNVRNFGGFVTQLEERSRSALLEWKCEYVLSDIGPMIAIFSQLGRLFPNFHFITIGLAQPTTSFLVIGNAITDYFGGMQQANPSVSHQLEFSQLLLYDDEDDNDDEDSFMDRLADFCSVNELSVRFRQDHDGSQPWAVLEKGNNRLVIQEHYVLSAEMEESDEDGDDENYMDDEDD